MINKLDTSDFIRIGYLLLIVNFANSCRTVISLNNNVEGFSDKKLEFQDFSKLKGDYEYLDKVLLETDEIHFDEKLLQPQTGGDTLIWMVYECQVETKQITSWGTAGLSNSKPRKFDLKFNLLVLTNDLFKAYNSALDSIYLEHPGYECSFYKVIESDGVLCPIFIFNNKSNAKNDLIEIYTPEAIIRLSGITDGKGETITNSLLLNYIYHPPTRGVLFKLEGRTIGIGA